MLLDKTVNDYYCIVSPMLPFLWGPWLYVVVIKYCIFEKIRRLQSENRCSLTSVLACMSVSSCTSVHRYIPVVSKSGTSWLHVSATFNGHQLVNRLSERVPEQRPMRWFQLDHWRAVTVVEMYRLLPQCSDDYRCYLCRSVRSPSLSTWVGHHSWTV